MSPHSFPTAVHAHVVLFAVYAFVGWLVEVVWRSASRKHFVNAGFLVGPYLPIYGFGGLALGVLSSPLAGASLLTQALVFSFVLSSLEYLTSYFAEKAFGLRLWDYSQNLFNLNGRVCLLYSSFWAVLGLMHVHLLSPVLQRGVAALDSHSIVPLSTAIVGTLIVDFCISAALMTSLRNKLLAVETSALESFNRLRDAFPDLDSLVLKTLLPPLQQRVTGLAEDFHARVFDRLAARLPKSSEYSGCVGDILANEEFLRLRNFRHHASTILGHVQRVSYLSYLVCKALDLDFRSAARGGLLHDFFLYDWHDHDVPDLPRHINHGVAHPAIALRNATRQFSLNAIEKDIVVKHMWPFTPAPPAFRESWVVSFVDKYVATHEYLEIVSAELTRERAPPAIDAQRIRAALRARLRSPRAPHHGGSRRRFAGFHHASASIRHWGRAVTGSRRVPPQQ